MNIWFEEVERQEEEEGQEEEEEGLERRRRMGRGGRILSNRGFGSFQQHKHLLLKQDYIRNKASRRIVLLKKFR